MVTQAILHTNRSNHTRASQMTIDELFERAEQWVCRYEHYRALGQFRWEAMSYFTALAYCEWIEKRIQDETLNSEASAEMRTGVYPALSVSLRWGVSRAGEQSAITLRPCLL